MQGLQYPGLPMGTPAFGGGGPAHAGMLYGHHNVDPSMLYGHGAAQQHHAAMGGGGYMQQNPYGNMQSPSPYSPHLGSSAFAGLGGGGGGGRSLFAGSGGGSGGGYLGLDALGAGAPIGAMYTDPKLLQQIRLDAERSQVQSSPAYDRNPVRWLKKDGALVRKKNSGSQKKMEEFKKARAEKRKESRMRKKNEEANACRIVVNELVRTVVNAEKAVIHEAKMKIRVAQEVRDSSMTHR